MRSYKTEYGVWDNPCAGEWAAEYHPGDVPIAITHKWAREVLLTIS